MIKETHQTKGDEEPEDLVNPGAITLDRIKGNHIRNPLIPLHPYPDSPTAPNSHPGAAASNTETPATSVESPLSQAPKCRSIGGDHLSNEGEAPQSKRHTRPEEKRRGNLKSQSNPGATTSDHIKGDLIRNPLIPLYPYPESSTAPNSHPGAAASTPKHLLHQHRIACCISTEEHYYTENSSDQQGFAQDCTEITPKTTKTTRTGGEAVYPRVTLEEVLPKVVVQFKVDQQPKVRSLLHQRRDRPFQSHHCCCPEEPTTREELLKGEFLSKLG